MLNGVEIWALCRSEIKALYVTSLPFMSGRIATGVIRSTILLEEKLFISIFVQFIIPEKKAFCQTVDIFVLIDTAS